MGREAFVIKLLREFNPCKGHSGTAEKLKFHDDVAWILAHSLNAFRMTIAKNPVRLSQPQHGVDT